MCTPTSSSKTNGSVDKVVTAKPVKSSALSKVVIYASILFALCVVLLPMVISEIVGGWTKKYTSPRFEMKDLSGKVAIVTGSNTGIGYHTALEMAKHGATVVVAARSAKKGEAAVESIKSEISSSKNEFLGDALFLPLDLSSLASIQAFASSFAETGLPLHALVLNAGIMKSPGAEFVGKDMTYGYDVTKDGFEAHIGVNHIGHFYLTKLLKESLVKSAPSRVVSVSSIAEENAFKPEGIRLDTWKSNEDNEIPEGYEDGLAYGQSKLANILFTKELAAQLDGKGVTAYSCHPGLIKTEISRHLDVENKADMDAAGWLQRNIMQMFMKYFVSIMFSAPDGALTQLHLAVSDPSKLLNGAFYHPIGKLIGDGRHPQAKNETLQKLLWEGTDRMIQEAGF